MARQVRGLITRVSAGEIEMIAPVGGEKDDDGHWRNIELAVFDTDGERHTYRVPATIPLDQLAMLGVAIDASGTSYLTTPSLDIFQVFLDEDTQTEFDELYQDLYDEYEGEVRG